MEECHHPDRGAEPSQGRRRNLGERLRGYYRSHLHGTGGRLRSPFGRCHVWRFCRRRNHQERSPYGQTQISDEVSDGSGGRYRHQRQGEPAADYLPREQHPHRQCHPRADPPDGRNKGQHQRRQQANHRFRFPHRSR